MYMCMVENIIDSTAGVRENGLGGHVHLSVGM